VLEKELALIGQYRPVDMARAAALRELLGTDKERRNERLDLLELD